MAGRAIFFAAALAGCAIGPMAAPAAVGPVPAGIPEHHYGALQFHAARAMNCPQEQLGYEAVDGRHFFVGCRQTFEMLLLEGADGLAHGAREGFATAAPTNRFAKEVGCAVQQTKDERVDVRTRIVDGCGQRVTYVHVCTSECTWIANVESARSK